MVVRNCLVSEGWEQREDPEISTVVVRLHTCKLATSIQGMLERKEGRGKCIDFLDQSAEFITAHPETVLSAQELTADALQTPPC